MNLNRYTFIGNLGADAEVRLLDGADRAVISFSVGVTESWKNAQGETQSRTDWVRCTLWRKANQTSVADYLKKGTKVYVEGRPQAKGYIDKEGGSKASLEVTVQEFQFLGGGQRDGAQPAASQQQRSAAVTFGGSTIASNASPGFAAGPPPQPEYKMTHEDDLPF